MSQPTSAEYSPEERETLLRIAHQSIEAAAAGKGFTPESVPAHLHEPRGPFTPIHVKGQLHGCVGYILPTLPLYLTIADTAASAATRDPRFPPLTLHETANVKVEISVLSKPFPIHPEEIESGKHGLMVTDGRR